MDCSSPVWFSPNGDIGGESENGQNNCWHDPFDDAPWKRACSPKSEFATNINGRCEPASNASQPASPARVSSPCILSRSMSTPCSWNKAMMARARARCPSGEAVPRAHQATAKGGWPLPAASLAEAMFAVEELAEQVTERMAHAARSQHQGRQMITIVSHRNGNARRR